MLVVGAGITGLATAVALQRRGFEVSVVEARADVSSGTGISIWPNALAALDEIGLGDAVRAAGGRVTAGAVRWHDGTWLRRPAADRMVRALGEPLVVIRRAALTGILTAALHPGTIEYGVAVQTIDADGTRVELTDGSVRTAAAVIGADGVDSVVARHLNGPLARRYAGYTAWRGVAEHVIAPELAGETMGAGIEVGHVPLGLDHTYWFATQRAPQGQVAALGELAHLRQLFGTWAEPIPTLLATTKPAELLRNDLYDRVPARHWARGRVVVAGDAAHPMRPHLGQGGCRPRGCGRPRCVGRPGEGCGRGVRAVRVTTAPPGFGDRARITDDRPHREPASRSPQRRGGTRHRAGSRAGAHPAPGSHRRVFGVPAGAVTLSEVYRERSAGRAATSTAGAGRRCRARCRA